VKINEKVASCIFLMNKPTKNEFEFRGCKQVADCVDIRCVEKILGLSEDAESRFKKCLAGALLSNPALSSK